MSLKPNNINREPENILGKKPEKIYPSTLHWFFNKQHANTKIQNKNPLLGTLTTGNSITSSGDNKISANSKGVSSPDDVDYRDEDDGKKDKNGGDDDDFLLRNNYNTYRRYDDNAQFVRGIADIESKGEIRRINDNTVGLDKN